MTKLGLFDITEDNIGLVTRYHDANLTEAERAECRAITWSYFKSLQDAERGRLAQIGGEAADHRTEVEEPLPVTRPHDELMVLPDHVVRRYGYPQRRMSRPPPETKR